MTEVVTTAPFDSMNDKEEESSTVTMMEVDIVDENDADHGTENMPCVSICYNAKGCWFNDPNASNGVDFRICYICFVTISCFHHKKDVSPLECKNLKLLCNALHEHTGDCDKALYHGMRDENEGVDGLVLNEKLREELKSILFYMSLVESDDANETECTDGAKSINLKTTLLSEVCENLKPITKLIFKSFIQAIYSVVKSRLLLNKKKDD